MVVIYVVDTSEWINLFQRYSDTVFPSLWVKIGDLISNTRIVSPTAVLDEIKRGHDELVEWCKKHPKMFYDNPLVHQQAMNITNKHPALVKHRAIMGTLTHTSSRLQSPPNIVH